MGNLCSIVLRGIDYVLRFIFPRYAAMMLDGYNPISEEHDRSTLNNSASSTPQISDSFPNGRCRVEEREENGDKMSPGEDNTEYFRGIVNNFFAIHNLQKWALTKSVTEKFLDLSGKVNNVSGATIITKNTSEKQIRDCSRSEEGQIHHSITKAMSSSEKIPKERTANQKDKTRALIASRNIGDKENDSFLANKTNSVEIADCGINKYLTESDKTNMKGIENPEYGPKNCGVVPPQETLRDQREIGEISAISSNEISSNNHSNDGCKSGMEPSGETIQDRKELCKSSSRDILLNDDYVAEYAHDVEVCKTRKLSLRKISLNKLYSGSHYAVIYNDENVELSDYSKEFPPLLVEAGMCYRNFTQPELLSGGTVVFQELSDHLSIPNWYNEEKIVYCKIPADIIAPQSSPVKLQQVEPFTFSRSSSGGGIVSDTASQKVYFPDLFPSSSGPLSQTYSPFMNTQSSTSFGELQTLTGKTIEIFTDLLNKSVAHDSQLASKNTHGRK